MDLSSILLRIIYQLDGERTIYAGLHLLRGKRSGQTLQDADNYNLRTFYSIFPKLSIHTYNEAVDVLRNASLLLINEDSLVYLTVEGKEVVNAQSVLGFNGFNYRGNEHLFFKRLSLIVQTLSNLKAGEKSFLPIQKDIKIQQFVKSILKNQPIYELGFSRKIKEEIQKSIDRSEMNETQKIILTHRLSGYEITGWTWDQLAALLDISPTSAYLYFVESLHILLGVIEGSNDLVLLNKMSENIKVTSYLTDSSKQTNFYLAKGLTIEEISRKRNLKQSTIEDHFVEIAANDSSFPIEKFVSKTTIETVRLKANDLGTKRLRVLKEEFNSLSYFQLRLILSSGSEGNS